MGGGGSRGGGGGGHSESSTKAERDPQSAKLAESAIPHIQKLQDILPIEEFAPYQPAGVAGLSPLQQFTIQSLLPGTLNAPPGTSGLLDLANSVGPTSIGAMMAGTPTFGARAALETLAPRLDGRAGNLSTGLDARSLNPFFALVASQLPRAHAFPSMTAFPELTPTMRGSPAIPTSMVVPGIGGPNVDVSSGGLSGSSGPVMPPVAPPAAPSPAPVDPFQPTRVGSFTVPSPAEQDAEGFFRMARQNGVHGVEETQRYISEKYKLSPEDAMRRVISPMLARLLANGTMPNDPSQRVFA